MNQLMMVTFGVISVGILGVHISLGYTQESRQYASMSAFEQAEGASCISATDGCNTFFLQDGKVAGGTLMACMDHIESWKCLSYIKESVTPILGGDRDEHGCIGSAGYVWSSKASVCVRPWEEKIPSIDKEESRICTMQYDPVCGTDGVTYGNACGAGKQPIAYQGECQTLVDNTLLDRLSQKCASYDLSQISSEKLSRAIERAQVQIESVKRSRIAVHVQKQKITILTYLTLLFEQELEGRGE